MPAFVAAAASEEALSVSAVCCCWLCQIFPTRPAGTKHCPAAAAAGNKYREQYTSDSARPNSQPVSCSTRAGQSEVPSRGNLTLLLHFIL